MMLKWVKNNCDSAAYVMKTDDDVYLNIPELIKFLDNNPDDDPNTMLYGQVVCSVEPIQDVNNKWLVANYLSLIVRL